MSQHRSAREHGVCEYAMGKYEEDREMGEGEGGRNVVVQ